MAQSHLTEASPSVPIITEVSLIVFPFNHFMLMR
jgi:hypothetical protein